MVDLILLYKITELDVKAMLKTASIKSIKGIGTKDTSYSEGRKNTFIDMDVVVYNEVAKKIAPRIESWNRNFGAGILDFSTLADMVEEEIMKKFRPHLENVMIGEIMYQSELKKMVRGAYYIAHSAKLHKESAQLYAELMASDSIADNIKRGSYKVFSEQPELALETIKKFHAKNKELLLSTREIAVKTLTDFMRAC